MHHHRAEHCIVVSGSAKVTNGEKIFLAENESTYISVKVNLELIQVQPGSYLREDDIVKFEDLNSRVKN